MVGRHGRRLALVGVVVWGLADSAGGLAGDPLRGPVVRVRDGDTLELAGRVVRLQGVAAPELHEPLGAASRAALERLVAGRPVACESDGSRSHGRIVAVCRVAGEDLGAQLVAIGLARDCPRFSLGRYAAAERAAAERGATIGRMYSLPAYCLARQAGG